MATDVLPMDVHKNNAYSENVKFDLTPPRSKSPKNSATTEVIEAETNEENPEISLKAMPSKDWEIDVKSLSSSRLWLQNYGLKKNRLDMHHILPQIGFKHSDAYDEKLKRPICSRYGGSMFQKYFRSDGKTFNIAVPRDKLLQIEHRLQQAIQLYKRRLEWLTTESRRVFGTIEEKSIAIVLDIRNLSPQQFDQYKAALERVVKEQITTLAKFSLIRACEDLEAYSQHCVPVTSESIDGAIKWIHKLSRCSPISTTATCEAVMKALSDNNLEAIYLFTEGSSCNGAREILKEKLTGCRIPVNVVSYNCTDSDTITFLKAMARITGGRFHAYAVVMELDTYESMPLNPETNQANILLKKTYGGVPPGAGVRDDVILLFEELEEARNNLGQIQALKDALPKEQSDSKNSSKKKGEYVAKNETYMSSREWLDKHGLKAKNLGFYDVLSGVAFKHQDGVVDIRRAPQDNILQTDAVNTPKLVNAKYCASFPHVRWKDGTVVHVQVTPEIHRSYEQRMQLALEALQQRIDWLSQGSRELFGTVIEDQVYFLIDTSSSMQPHIQFVKDKLFILMQEQLRHKQKFNLISFDSRALPWKDRMVDVNEKTLHQAWTWIKELSCRGSTNTMAAIRHALNDHHTQAIYLLTDGRPDQPPKSILSQVCLQASVPIHTISFNCADREANEFLCQLAKDSGGRFHYYSEDGIDPEGPEPWESEDIRLLKQEMETGYRNLEKVAMLRDECGLLAWKQEEEAQNRDRPEKVRVSASLNSYTFRSRTPLDRPLSAPGHRHRPSPPSYSSPRPSTAHGYRTPRGRSGGSKKKARPHSAGSKLPQPPLLAAPSGSGMSIARQSSHKNIAAHTRTSLLRQLNCKVGHLEEPEWLLPETRALFEKQADKQKKLVQAEEYKIRAMKKGKKSDSKPMSSRKWLAKHGLSAQKLTILDALSPTFIPHEPKYVPIINKHVMSKVFDDILPIAHASTSRKRMKIVNPQGVNLDIFMKEVEDAIEKYKKRLNRLVWEALPQNEKEEFKSDAPINFLDNKLALMQALDRCGWPIREQDIILLENEIKQGEVYIQQAKDLQAAGKDRGKSLEVDLEKYDDAASIASEKQYEGMGEIIEKKTLKKVKKVRISSLHTKRALDTLRGQRIIGRNDEDGYYYPGFVIKCPDSRHALVEYDEIGKQTVPTRFIIPMSGAISRPPIRIGDYVLARVVNQDTGLECYVPGIVQMTPRRMEDAAKFFTVIMYTGQSNHFQRSHLVKISKMRFTFLVRYIDEMSPNSKVDDNVQETQVRFQLDSEKVTPSQTSLRSRSRSESSGGSRSRSDSRSNSRSRSRSPSLSRSRSRSRSNSPRSPRSPKSPSSDGGNESKAEKQQQARIDLWARRLEKQKKKQEAQQDKIKRYVRKLKAMQKKLDASNKGEKEEQKLLEMILDELNQTKKAPRPVAGNRTEQWLKDQNGDQELAIKYVNLHVENGSSEVPPFLLELRKSLPVLQLGEEVLARWGDEGWYYRGTVRHDCGDNSYLLEDSLGYMEKIWREDIIADGDDANQVLQPKDAIIGMHPDYTFSYAPGVVIEVGSDLQTSVRFYDGTEHRLPREEVFRVPQDKFEYDVAYILKCEEQWVGQAVVARNDKTGLFQLGAIRARVGNGRQYSVEWSDGTMGIQSAPYIFGPFTKQHPFSVGDRVLAIMDRHNLLYLPGIVMNAEDGRLTVKFCNGSMSDEVNARQSFWLSQEYYDAAVSFYRGRKSQVLSSSTPLSTDDD